VKCNSYAAMVRDYLIFYAFVFIASGHGAAGLLVMVLLLVYFSAQILFVAQSSPACTLGLSDLEKVRRRIPVSSHFANSFRIALSARRWAALTSG
jgi:hypothetical protein